MKRKNSRQLRLPSLCDFPQWKCVLLKGYGARFVGSSLWLWLCWTRTLSFVIMNCSCSSPAPASQLIPFIFFPSPSLTLSPSSFPFLCLLFLPLSISEFHFPVWYLASEKTKMSCQIELPEHTLSFSQELWFFSIRNMSNHLHPIKGLEKERTNYVTASCDLGKKITHFLPYHRWPLLRLDSIIHAVSLPAWNILWFYDSIYTALALR